MTTRSHEGNRASNGLGPWSWSLTLLLAAIGGAGGYLASGQIKTFYQANLTLYVGDAPDVLEPSKDDIDTSATLASAYGSLIRSQPVLDSVARELDLSSSWQGLKDRVQVDLSAIQAPTIGVSVRAGSSARAEAIAAALGERAIALSPASLGGLLTEGSSAFAVRQTGQLEDAITRTESQIARLRQMARLRAALSVPEPGLRERLDDKMREQFEQIEQWRGNYASVKLLSAQASPNSVRVLEPAQASTAPVRPNIWIDIALGVAMGAVVGFGIGQVGVLRRRRRRSDAAQSAIVRSDPWVEQLGESHT